MRRDERRDASSRRGRPRRRVIPLWRSRSALIGAVVLAIVAIGGGLWWVWQARYPHYLAETVNRTMVEAAADLGFRVDEVFVVGRHHTSKEAILEALGVERGAPIFILDLDDARQRILTLPWVRSASIERLLPDTLVVRIVERQPVALWQRDHDFSVIDEDGAVIATDNVGDFNHLMVVVGDDAPVHALALIEMLHAEPDLDAMVKAAVRIGSRRWDVYLAGGIDVRLPADEPLDAWRRLAAYQKRHHLFERGVRSLDLRLNDRIVIGPGAEDPGIEGVGGDDA
jgi:cell division protein FtsQ